MNTSLQESKRKLDKQAAREASSFKLPHWSTLIGLIVLIGILVGDRLMTKSAFPTEPVQMVLDRNIPLQEVLDADKTIVQLRKGDVVKYYGVLEGGAKRPCGLVVETKDGQRGLLSVFNLGYPLFRTGQKDSTHVRLVKFEKEKYATKCHVVNEHGEKAKVDLDDIRPVLPDSLRAWILREDGRYYMSKEKFERLYIGASLEENDARYRPAWQLIKTKKKGWEAYYPNLEIVDYSEGQIFNPIITYDADGKAISYKSDGHARSNNRFLIKYMPFVKRIADTDFFARFIAGSIYEVDLINSEEDYGEEVYMSLTDVPWWRWVCVVLYLICCIIWVFFMCTLPSLIVEAGLYCRWTYYHLNDSIVAIFFSIVALVATYIWMALMIVWGCLWIFTPIIIFIGLCAWGFSQRYLATRPSNRCVKCRRMEANRFKERRFIQEYNEWRPLSEAIDRQTSRWQTWTEVTTKYSNGSTSTHKENIQNHSRTETRYADYTVLYHVKEFISYYECQGCHYIEEIPDEELQELQRLKTGEHTTVTTT